MLRGECGSRDGNWSGVVVPAVVMVVAVVVVESGMVGLMTELGRQPGHTSPGPIWWSARGRRDAFFVFVCPIAYISLRVLTTVFLRWHGSGAHHRVRLQLIRSYILSVSDYWDIYEYMATPDPGDDVMTTSTPSTIQKSFSTARMSVARIRTGDRSLTTL